jgi:hypothetical protein
LQPNLQCTNTGDAPLCISLIQAELFLTRVASAIRECRRAQSSQQVLLSVYLSVVPLPVIEPEPQEAIIL